jgi:hypothetical protein
MMCGDKTWYWPATTTSNHSCALFLFLDRPALEKYWTNQEDLFVPKNMENDGHMDNSAYDTIVDDIPEYGNPDMLREWTALYYALIEEVDAQIGRLLHTLGDDANNTLVIFTSDHGEMLGAHGRRDKNTFYEESSRVPLAFSYPGVIEEGTVVDDLASHLDVFATILDYIGAAELDNSDGQSLRNMIERREISQTYDEDVVVAEWDFRKPIGDQLSGLDRTIDDRPSYMVRKDTYKLMMQKLATSTELDMMFHLESDPFEVNNLLGRNGMSADDTTISKAEHLRCLLLDWMERFDGSVGYYSNPAANFEEGSGDMNEIRNRQSWRQIGFWVSDSTMEFGKVGWNGQDYVRNEYLYLGTRNDEVVVVTSISLTGDDASFFRVDTTSIPLRFRDCHALKISFVAHGDMWTEREFNAAVILTGIGIEEKIIQLHVQNLGAPDAELDSTAALTSPPEIQSTSSPSKMPTAAPTASPEDEATNSPTSQPSPHNLSAGTTVTVETEENDASGSVLFRDGYVCENDSQCASGACASKWLDIYVVRECCADGAKFHYLDDVHVCGNQPKFASCFEDDMCQSKKCEERICVEGSLIFGGE